MQELVLRSIWKLVARRLKKPKNRDQIRAPIAFRRLRVSGTETFVAVKIGRPRPAGGDWKCPVEISGLEGQNGVHYAWGVDSMSALQFALVLIRRALDASGKTLTWIGGHPGDEGFPTSSGEYPGPLKERRRIERFIKAERGRYQRKFARLRARHEARKVGHRKNGS